MHFYDIPDTPGGASVVFPENEIWNRLKQFLPVCPCGIGIIKITSTELVIFRWNSFETKKDIFLVKSATSD